jgi:hypothetical protein
MPKQKYYVKLEASIYGKDGKALPELAAILHPPHATVCLMVNRYRFRGARKVKVDPPTAEALGLAGRSAIWITDRLVETTEMINMVSAAYMGPMIKAMMEQKSPFLEGLRGKTAVTFSGGTEMRVPLTYANARTYANKRLWGKKRRRG